MLRRGLARCFSHAKEPVRVAVTGGSGQISYSLLFRIASGALFGPEQPVILQIYDLPQMQSALRGVVMELHDCAFPLVKEIIATDVLSTVLSDVQYAFFVGSKPRGPGMERADLLRQNGEIFVKAGEDLNKHAHKDCKVLVVGNPVNTNCLIAMHHAPSLPKENFTAMMRLDHNRALAQVGMHLNCQVKDIAKMAVWGNHSPTMYPDLNNAEAHGKSVKEQVEDKWVINEFIPVVQQRGSAIIQARKASSAASAASAAIDHMRDWALGSNGEWVSMGVPSELYNGAYGIPSGIVFSYPMTCDNGKYELVKGLELGDFSKEKLKITIDELVKEKESVQDFLKA